MGKWLELPHLHRGYNWNLYERRAGWYVDNWSQGTIDAVDTFQFGVREALKLMDLNAAVDGQHEGDAWVNLYNVAVNEPTGSQDYPPHMNIITYWGEPQVGYDGGVNGHFYTSDAGHLDPERTWYAWDVEPNCANGERKPGVSTWVAHVDAQCDVLFEEQVTPAGELRMRLSADAPIYTLRALSPTQMEILRGDGEGWSARTLRLIARFRRSVHEAR